MRTCRLAVQVRLGVLGGIPSCGWDKGLPSGGREKVSSSGRDGEMPEWFNGAVSKTVDLHGSGGSNPPLSAIVNNIRRHIWKKLNLYG